MLQFVLLLPLLFGVLAEAALPVCARKVVGRPEFSAHIWQYYGQKDFNTSVHSQLGMGEEESAYRVKQLGLGYHNGSYEPLGGSLLRSYEFGSFMMVNPVRAEFESGSEGDTLLARNQFFSVNLMHEINYLDDEGVQEQNAVLGTLNPDQVRVVELTQSFTHSELLNKFGKIPSAARRDTQTDSWNEYQRAFARLDGEEWPEYDQHYELKVGASWLLAGQTPLRNYTLPLETGLLKPIDRGAHKFIWETGRAGQTLDSAFEESLRANLYAAYFQLMIMGGDLDEAYVFAHALDAKHARLFMSKFGMKVYSGYNDNPNEMCLVLSLREFLRRYPLHTYSQKLLDLMNASKGSLLSQRAFAMMLRMRQRLDFVLSNTEGTVVAVRDFSALPYPELRSEIDALVFPQFEKQAILNELATYSPTIAFRDASGDHARASSGFYAVGVNGIRQEGPGADRAGLQLLRTFLNEQNAVELFVRSTGGQSAPSLLRQTYDHMIQRLSVAGIADPKSWLTDQGVHFCVTSKDGGILRALHGLRPVQGWYVHRDQYYDSRSLFGNPMSGIMRNRVVVPGLHIESLCFTSAQIAEWETPQASSPLTLGQEHRDEYFANPQLNAP